MKFYDSETVCLTELPIHFVWLKCNVILWLENYNRYTLYLRGGIHSEEAISAKKSNWASFQQCTEELRITKEIPV